MDGDHASAFERVANKGVPNGYASLDSSGKVVQDPANATATPTPNKIPIANADGKLDDWITVFSGSAKGLVPQSPGGTNYFLRADGTWAAPPGGGSGVGLDVYPKILTPGSGWDDTTDAAIWEMITYTNGTKQEVLRYADNTSNQRWWEFVVLDAANFSQQFKIYWSSPASSGSVVWEVGVA